MHINKVILLGRVSGRGVQSFTNANGHPYAAFSIAVDEVSSEGKTFTAFIPCRIYGKGAEVAETLLPGEEVMIDGKLSLEAIGDGQGGKMTKLMVTSFRVVKGS